MKARWAQKEGRKIKRLMPASLISALQNGVNFLRADLFQIALPTGQFLNATSGQWDITLTTYNASTDTGTPGWTQATTTFYAVTYGSWTRGAITSEANFRLESNTMSLVCAPKAGVQYPNLNIGILNAALNGLFDAANVMVWTAYMPIGQYGNCSAGIETKFFGTITKIVGVGRIQVEFEVADPLYLLNMKVPTRLYQSNCPWAFCDSNCGLSAPNYTIAFTAGVGSTQNELIPATAFTQPEGYFTQGVATCTAGGNVGLAQTVALHEDGVLEMMLPWLFPVADGDTFSVIKGCDKSLPTCHATTTANGIATDNSIHFGGMPFIPPPAAAV
jgi:uncharacterized phage protein (TIGR02218 family)